MTYPLVGVTSGSVLDLEETRKKLMVALRKRLKDRSLILDATLTDFLKANSVPKPGKIARSEQETITSEALDLLDYTRYLPQPIPLTLPMMTDLFDPVMSAVVPTGLYRLTMRKLLRLSLSQLQRQAELMKIDSVALDEIGLARSILIHADEKTELIPELAKMLLAKEIAFVFGIKFQILLRGPNRPSAATTVHIRPAEMIKSTLLSDKDLLAECENQGIAVNRRESKRQLAVRLVVWWTAHPTMLREPLTKPFADFLAHVVTVKGV